MFEGSLVESQHLLRTNNRWTALLSALFQVTAVLALVTFPLLHPEVLPFSMPSALLTAPPPPTPPVKPVEVQTAQAAQTSPAISAPVAAPRIQAFSNQQTDVAPGPFMPTLTMPGPGFPRGIAVPEGGGPRVVAQPTAAAGPAKAVKVSAGVAQGMLLTPFQPVYPRIAIAARVEGTVVVQVVLSKTGTIEGLHVTSGPAMLTGAALDAVRAARYAPYRLSGEPVEVETTISVIFKLGS